MSQQELLAKIEIRIADFCEDEEDFCDVCSPWKALRAVVGLHQPMRTFPKGSNNSVPICLQCRDTEFAADYPCPTIQAIEKELG